jgi:hypothetical protein
MKSNEYLSDTPEIFMMTVDQARKFIILSSLFITAFQLIFLLVAPAFNYPLTYPKNLALLDIITPVFLGYLGSATAFVFMTPPPNVTANNQFLGYLVVGSIIIYVCAALATFISFGYSNRVGAPIPGGMSVENLATAMSLSLGVLAATTSVLIPYLFVSPQLTQKHAHPA